MDKNKSEENIKEIGIFHLNSARENISLLRHWMFQIATISAVIIGFSLPTFGGNSQSFRNEWLLTMSLIFYGLIVLFAMGPLLYFLQRENRKLAQQTKEIANLTHSQEKGNKKAREKKAKKVKEIVASIIEPLEKYWWDLIFGMFILATLFLVLSIIIIPDYSKPNENDIQIEPPREDLDVNNF